MTFTIDKFRKNFPILQKIYSNGNNVVYLDNAATTQKPQCVIDAITDFYTNYNSNIHRGMYDIAEMATNMYEGTRTKIAQYFGGCRSDEIVFVRGATEAINLVAHSYVRKFLTRGDEIIIGAAEHHSNYIPWQVIEHDIGVMLKIAPLAATGEIDIEAYKGLFTKNTKFVAIQHASNVLGSINDIKTLTKIAHSAGAKILIDGAGTLLHSRINIRDIDCDFFACSGHKSYGPTGSGVLFGKYDILEKMPPYQTGGNVVNKVTREMSSFKLPPQRFEAGTQDIASVIGLGRAIDFLSSINWDEMKSYFNKICEYAYGRLSELPFLEKYNSPNKMSGVFSFNIAGVHAHDVATILGKYGICVRAGTHCAQPLMQLLNIPATVRISLAPYNTIEEVDAAIDVIKMCKDRIG